MQNHKLILFDFDGVIIDGMYEYWGSSLLACKNYLKSKELPLEIKDNLPLSDTFRAIRPWVKYGWEMVLITHEILKAKNPLDNSNKDVFINNYHENCLNILRRNSWDSATIQQSLNDARKYQIDLDVEKWIKLHTPFIEVIDYIKKAQHYGLHIGIISTKGCFFTEKIIHKLNVYPELIFGYESGSKEEIITLLSKDYKILGFIEDRLKTLSKIIKNDNTKHVPCYLADWGYLKNSDKIALPEEIKILKLTDLKDMVAVFT